MGNRLVRIKKKAMVGRASRETAQITLLIMAFLFLGRAVKAEELSFCDILLTKSKIYAGVYKINPDGSTEYESEKPEIGGKTKEERENEERRRQQEEYWRDRQPAIQERKDEREEIEKRKPVPGRDFPVLPTKPDPVKKAPPKPYFN